MGELSVKQLSSLTGPSCETGARKKKKNYFNFTFKFQKVFSYYSLFSCKLILIKGPEGRKKYLQFVSRRLSPCASECVPFA